MQLFYNPHISAEDKIFNFDKDESRHITKVLRKKTGDTIHITNGEGYLFKAELTSTAAKRCSVEIISSAFHPPNDNRIHVAIAPTKMNDRFEWFLEKATEIGIEEITPIICDHSERKALKVNRFEKIVQAAMKQSLKCYLPKLNPPMPFQDFIKSNFKGQRFIAHCYESDKQALKTVIRPNTDTLILIGPEGDFSVKEIETALSQNYIPVTLGNSRLRTETAGVIACHTYALINQ